MEWINLYGEMVQAKVTSRRKAVYKSFTFQLHPEENLVIDTIRHPFLELYPLLLRPFDFNNSNEDKKDALRILKKNFLEHEDTLKKYCFDKYQEIDVFIKNKEYML